MKIRRRRIKKDWLRLDTLLSLMTSSMCTLTHRTISKWTSFLTENPWGRRQTEPQLRRKVEGVPALIKGQYEKTTSNKLGCEKGERQRTKKRS
jgi:hypothetical protein